MADMLARRAFRVLAVLLALPLVSASPVPSACDRTCLGAVLDRYLAALVAHRPQSLPVAPDLRATENGVMQRLGEGHWKTVTGVSSYRIRALDPASGGVAFIGVLKEGAASTMYSLRLKVANGRITEAETILARLGMPGEAGKAPGKLVTARAAFEDPLPAPERRPRAQLITAANSYYAGIEQGTGRVVAFSDKCHRIENGVPLVNNPDYSFDVVSPTGKKLPNFAAMGCKEQFDTGLWSTDSVADKRFPVVDEKHGIVAAFTIYKGYARASCANVRGYGPVCPRNKTPPFNLDLVEFFRIRGGKIHEMESVWTVLPPGVGSGWEDKP